MATKNRYSQPFNTIAVRLSLPCLHKGDPHPEFGKGDYTTQFLVSKTTPGQADYHGMQEMLNELAEVTQCEATVEDIMKAVTSAPFMTKRRVLRDGDSDKYKVLDGFPGNLIMAARCKPQHGDMELFKLVDGKAVKMSRDENIIQKELYSGCWCVLRLVACFNPTHGSVSFYIKSVIKVGDDELLGVPSEDQEAVIAGMDLSSIPGLAGTPIAAGSPAPAAVAPPVPQAATPVVPPAPVAAAVPPPAPQAAVPVAPPAPVAPAAVAPPVQSAKSLMDAAVNKK